MAKKMKRIAFNLELAKAINSGEKEGRIVTREYRNRCPIYARTIKNRPIQLDLFTQNI